MRPVFHLSISTNPPTLAQAKEFLAWMARDIYVERVREPTPQQLYSAGSYVAAVQALDAAYWPKFQQVADDIQAASTIEEAFQIYLTLRDFQP